MVCAKVNSCEHFYTSMLTNADHFHSPFHQSIGTWHACVCVCLCTTTSSAAAAAVRKIHHMLLYALMRVPWNTIQYNTQMSISIVLSLYMYLFVSTKAPSIDINNCKTIASVPVCECVGLFVCDSSSQLFFSVLTITITPSGQAIYWLALIAISDVYAMSKEK